MFFSLHHAKYFPCQKFSYKVPTGLLKDVHLRLVVDDNINEKRSFLVFDFESTYMLGCDPSHELSYQTTLPLSIE